MEVKVMDGFEKAQSAAITFTIASAGILMLAYVSPVLGIRGVQKATKVHLLADAHRAASLAKTYDAKAAALAINTLAKKLK